MRGLRLSACVMTLLLGVVGCASQPIAHECPKPMARQAPPAWMMAPPPSLLEPLNEIIGVSESESKP